jgi:hypothetical protein
MNCVDGQFQTSFDPWRQRTKIQGPTTRPLVSVATQPLEFLIEKFERRARQICGDAAVDLMECRFSKKHDRLGLWIGASARPCVEIDETSARCDEPIVESP